MQGLRDPRPLPVFHFDPPLPVGPHTTFAPRQVVLARSEYQPPLLLLDVILGEIDIARIILEHLVVGVDREPDASCCAKDQCDTDHQLEAASAIVNLMSTCKAMARVCGYHVERMARSDLVCVNPFTEQRISMTPRGFDLGPEAMDLRLGEEEEEEDLPEAQGSIGLAVLAFLAPLLMQRANDGLAMALAGGQWDAIGEDQADKRYRPTSMAWVRLHGALVQLIRRACERRCGRAALLWQNMITHGVVFLGPAVLGAHVKGDMMGRLGQAAAMLSCLRHRAVPALTGDRCDICPGHLCDSCADSLQALATWAPLVEVTEEAGRLFSSELLHMSHWLGLLMYASHAMRSKYDAAAVGMGGIESNRGLVKRDDADSDHYLREEDEYRDDISLLKAAPFLISSVWFSSIHDHDVLADMAVLRPSSRACIRLGPVRGDDAMDSDAPCSPHTPIGRVATTRDNLFIDLVMLRLWLVRTAMATRSWTTTVQPWRRTDVLATNRFCAVVDSLLDTRSMAALAASVERTLVGRNRARVIKCDVRLSHSIFHLSVLPYVFLDAINDEYGHNVRHADLVDPLASARRVCVSAARLINFAGALPCGNIVRQEINAYASRNAVLMGWLCVQSESCVRSLVSRCDHRGLSWLFDIRPNAKTGDVVPHRLARFVLNWFLAVKHPQALRFFMDVCQRLVEEGLLPVSRSSVDVITAAVEAQTRCQDLIVVQVPTDLRPGQRHLWLGAGDHHHDHHPFTSVLQEVCCLTCACNSRSMH
ncbi:hypothetical protein ml_92 [Mollivirus sibericum]|uniref:hypothetical protein n=1 Tax=Mollivirus sibericum TaxID=1678078 RepID=UPI0006B2ED76|nr:hypothetical protein ml_92 [Mollivirus sibericum]ALD61894.1 hypothetical protein ml_92 [Mollivirus sibericum]